MTTPQISIASITSNPPTLIDPTFPIAGQDNNSQGFRTNYLNIITNLTFAANDITGLWANVDGLNSNVTILQANVGNYGNLSANVTTLQGNVVTINSTAVFNNATNQLGGNIIAGASKSYASSSFVTNGALAINYASGDFQNITMAANAAPLSFAGWPATGYATLSVMFNIPASYYVTFESNISASTGLGAVANVTNVQSITGQTFTSLQTGNFLFEFSTFNGGTTVLIVEKFYP